MTSKNSGASVMITAKSYDKLDRLRSTATALNAQSSALNSSTYSYNTANQRSRADLLDGSHWSYGYDALGQVISGQKLWGDDTAVGGQQFGYAFNDMGNRTATNTNGRAASETCAICTDKKPYKVLGCRTWGHSFLDGKRLPNYDSGHNLIPLAPSATFMNLLNLWGLSSTVSYNGGAY